MRYARTQIGSDPVLSITSPTYYPLFPEQEGTEWESKYQHLGLQCRALIEAGLDHGFRLEPK